jgi:inhibitor of cysteine peptidase
MKHTVLGILGIACIIAAAFAGCTITTESGGKTPASAPAGTAAPAGNLVVTEEQDGAMVSVGQGNVITLKLAENPATGYQWNLVVTPGLNITSDTYLPSDMSGTKAGSGGTRSWEIRADGTGTQMIRAIYLRPWEPVAGNETGFGMTVNVEKA